MSRPVVSCIMPTRDRPVFFRASVELFRAQTLPDCELIVVDDGDAAVEHLLPPDKRIRYVRLPAPAPVGRKRNLACECARGEFIAHWDDDDWYAADRLERQVAALRDGGAELTGVRETWYEDLRNGAEFRYTSAGTWASCLCYSRAVWERFRFAEISRGEDAHFLRRARVGLAAPDAPDIQVCTLHEGNAAGKRTDSPEWKALPPGTLRRGLGDDWEPYARWRPSASDAVTVSLPYFRCRGWIRRAVDSILRQTHRNLRLVVVNDGDPEPPWPRLADIRDPRLVRFDLPANRGRYFADQVVLSATNDPWFLVQDADDWSEPDRIERLLAVLNGGDAAGALSTVLRHRRADDARPYPERPQNPLTPDGRLIHRASHSGLYRSDALREIGGYYGGYRIAYDTLVVNLLLFTRGLLHVDRPLYHRMLRPASLTTSDETGLRSAGRKAIQAQLRASHERAHRAWVAFDAGEIDRERFLRTIRAATSRFVTPATRRLIDREAIRLRDRMAASRTAVARGRPRVENRSLPPGSATAWSPATVARRIRLVRDVSEADRALDLVARVTARRARHILQVGCGPATVLLAHYAARTGARVTTITLNDASREGTVADLARFGLSDRVELRGTLGPPDAGVDFVAVETETADELPAESLSDLCRALGADCVYRAAASTHRNRVENDSHPPSLNRL